MNNLLVCSRWRYLTTKCCRCYLQIIYCFRLDLWDEISLTWCISFQCSRLIIVGIPRHHIVMNNIQIDICWSHIIIYSPRNTSSSSCELRSRFTSSLEPFMLIVNVWENLRSAWINVICWYFCISSHIWAPSWLPSWQKVLLLNFTMSSFSCQGCSVKTFELTLICCQQETARRWLHESFD